MNVLHDENGELLNVAPFDRMGGWIANHYLYYKSAKNSFTQLEQTHANFNKRVQELILEFGEEDYVVHPDMDEFDYVIHLLSTNVIIYSCMTIEAFINLYGVKRLGDIFYKRNIEKMGITEKLQIVLLSCNGYLCKKEEEIVKVTRKLFDIRNSLIHPKSKKITAENVKNYISSNDIQEEIEIINNLDKFFQLFATYDEAINLEIERLKRAL